MARRLSDMTEAEVEALLGVMARTIVAVAGGAGVERPRFALFLLNDPKMTHATSNCIRGDVLAACDSIADLLDPAEAPTP